MEEFNWSNIFGNEEKVRQIRDMIKSQQFPNAVIFSGLAGIGKKKIAKAAAMSLLCESEDKPCGHCPSCHSFMAASHPDYYYMEPDKTKANPMIKIDQVRALQSEVSLMPVMSNLRMVIIDDAELMNIAAQNCLLKTIEEPSGLSKFILITSNRSRLLMTLRSRCMIINFERLSEENIKQGLENKGIDNAAEISVIANGSLGQALKLSENDGLKIREDTINFLETLSKMTIEDIFVKGQVMSAQTRENFKEWTMHFQKLLRDLLIVNTDIEKSYYYNRDLRNKLSKLKSKFSDSAVFEMLQEATEIQRRLNSNANLELLIESFFMRLKQSLKN